MQRSLLLCWSRIVIEGCSRDSYSPTSQPFALLALLFSIFLLLM
ncbi:MAG: hypothetical protein QE493_04170 [Verrucomicrobiae bacterium]|nr:hypothetical protein [Verrucomicrobiae bacterium]